MEYSENIAFEVSKKESNKEVLLRLHEFRGRLPADSHFDRQQANERDDELYDSGILIEGIRVQNPFI